MESRLVIYPDDRLRQVSIPYKFLNTEKLIDKMKTVMKESNGIGLSAIQIGIPVRVFLAGDPPQVFINPRILKRGSFEKKDWEGCLSCPDCTVRVKRPTKITMRYQNEEQQWITRDFTGFEARVIQHEFDHLNGKLIIDRGKVYRP